MPGSTNLAQACRENNNLVNFAHPFQEVVYAWTLDNVHVVPVIFDLHWHDVIRMLDGLEKVVSRHVVIRRHTR